MTYYENADVSSGATIQAVAAVLQGQMFRPMPGLEKRRDWLQRINRLPERWIRRLVELFSWRSGHHPRLSSILQTKDLTAWNVAQYDFLPPEQKFETIVLGAPSGAAAYLCSCLNAPFLSHTFVASFRQSNHPDNIQRYYERGEQLITPILTRNPDLQIVNHYDPVHDRFLVSRINHVRMKLLRLPTAYQAFIRQRLAPDGQLIALNCTATWGQYIIGPRYTFQVGGLGGISDETYIRGSPILDNWLQQQGSRHRGGWTLPLKWRQEPESEWGTQPEFIHALEQYAEEEDIPVRTLTRNRVEAFSQLAFNAWQWLYYLLEIRPMAILVDSFLQINATAPRKSALLPLWLPFNCTDSRDFLRSMVAEFPENLPVLFQPWPSFSPGPDIARPQDWHQALHGLRGRWLGVDPHHYPVDLASLATATPALQSWIERHPDPLPRTLRNAELETLLALLEETPAPEESETSPPE